jgi:hypothetical protein
MAEIKVVTPHMRRQLILGGGTVAGLIAGAVVSALMLSVMWARGMDVWIGAKAAAFPFFHERVMAPGFDAGPVVAGLISHFAVSIFWGIVFAWAVFGLSRAATTGVGVIWGLFVWAVMYFIVLPLVGAWALTKGVPLVGPVIQHAIFGLTLGIGFLPFQRERPEILRWWRPRRV